MKPRIALVHPNAIMPTYGSDGAACFDLYAAAFIQQTEPLNVTCGTATFVDSICVDTGVVFEIPKGYGLFVFSRSGQMKHNVSLANAVGVVDSDYRGSVQIILRRNVTYGYVINGAMTAAEVPYIQYDFPYDRVVGAYHHHKVSVGDRVAQACILPIERAEFEVVPFAQLSSTARQAGGFGSTGK